jgi:hypothetical protein
MQQANKRTHMPPTGAGLSHIADVRLLGSGDEEASGSAQGREFDD